MVARWDPAGAHVFSRVVAPTSSFAILHLALTASGEVVVAGPQLEPYDFGAGVVAPGAGSSALVRFDAAGALRFAVALDGGGAWGGLARGPDGAIHVATSEEVARLDDQGALTDRRALPFSNESIGGFAVDAAGEPVLVVGSELWRWTGGEAVPTQLACDAALHLAGGPTGDIALIARFEEVFSADQGPLLADGPIATAGARLGAIP